jgi:acyl-coenzyme A synthetase/AMP-(fatty) acid ligase
MTILKPIFSQDAGRPAALATNTVITYGRLCADIDSMAQWLFAQGLEPGDRVTIHVREVGNISYWDWIMHLGALRAGLVQSTGPIPPAIARTGAVGPYKAALGDLSKLAPRAEPELKLAFDPAGGEPLFQQLEIPPGGRNLDGLENQAVRLLATSGTTARPKVMRWDANLFEARLRQVRETGDLGPQVKLLCALGLLTTTGLRYPIAQWQMGGFVLLAGLGAEPTDPAEAVAQSTFVASSPFRMRGLLNQVPGDWPGKAARTIELFGGRVPPEMRDEVLARCCSKLTMSYGATEVGRVAAGDTAMVDRHSGAVGFVEPGITVEIVDQGGNAKPAGETGIVRMKSDFMCDGYLGQPAQPGQRAALREGWFYPGDFGIVFDDGLFAITGRLSDTLNLSGAKVSPLVLEERIAKLPEVDDVCVTALEMDRIDVLAVAVACGDDVDLQHLRREIGKLVPRQFPLTIIRVPRIPRNAMGRIPRQAFAKTLTEQAKQRLKARREQAAPDPKMLN